MANIYSFIISLDGTRQNLATALGVAPGSTGDVPCDTIVFRGEDITQKIRFGAVGGALALHIDPSATPTAVEEPLILSRLHGLRLSRWDVQGTAGEHLGVLCVEA